MARVQILLRADFDQKARWVRAAEAEGLSLNAWLGKQADAAAARRSPLPAPAAEARADALAAADAPLDEERRRGIDEDARRQSRAHGH